MKTIIMTSLVLPFAWSAIVIGLIFLRSKLSTDRVLSVSLRLMSVLSLTASTVLLSFIFNADSPYLLIDLGEWLHIKNSMVPIAIYLDKLGAGYLLLCDIILTLVIRFSTNYLIGDRGFKRFFVCIGLLRGGLGLVCLGGTVDTLLIGWELVGICSVLLIGFFRHHVQAARNSWLSLCAYRVGDIGLILSVGLIHELGHGIHFDNLAATVFAPGGEHASIGFLISALIIFGSLAKSGQFPLHWWVPRAMEGPSPSSAVFYGALSIHLGAFLLMRTFDVWSSWFDLRVVVGVIGLTTAALTSLTSRATSNIKTQLAYSSISQLGLIYLELALGLWEIAIFHMFSHAILRSWQFLRATSIFDDFQEDAEYVLSLEARNAKEQKSRLISTLNRRLFALAQNGFLIEAVFCKWVLRPMTRLLSIYNHAQVAFAAQIANRLPYGRAPETRPSQSSFYWSYLPSLSFCAVFTAGIALDYSGSISLPESCAPYIGLLAVIITVIAGGCIPFVGWMPLNRRMMDSDGSPGLRCPLPMAVISGLTQALVTIAVSRLIPRAAMEDFIYWACTIFPIMSCLCAFSAASIRQWHSRMSYVSVALQNVYCVLMIFPDFKLQLAGGLAMFFHLCCAAVLIRMERSSEILRPPYPAHYRGLFFHDNRMAEMALGVSIVICGAPLTGFYFIQDAVGHIMLLESGILFQTLMFVAISICAATTYLSYTYLFHGERVEPRDLKHKAFSRSERRSARFAVAIGLTSGLILALII